MYIDQELDQLLNIAVAEDVRSGDLTSQACIPDAVEVTAKLVLKQAGVLAGLPFLQRLFNKIDPRIQVTLLVEEGSFQKAGTLIAKIQGPARGIVTGERIALNILQHAS